MNNVEVLRYLEVDEYMGNLDKLASAIKDIVSDLYPSRKKYSNTPLVGEDGFNKKDLNRLITFEIDG